MVLLSALGSSSIETGKAFWSSGSLTSAHGPAWMKLPQLQP